MFVLAANSLAQRNVTQAIPCDPLMEADAKHNLDVAWQAFGPARQAYKQVILRFDETYAAYPDFSKIDEFLYLAGTSSYYLSENKGKQKVDPKSEKDMKKFGPAKLKEDAIGYLTLLVEKHPDSQYAGEARKTLDLIKAKN